MPDKKIRDREQAVTKTMLGVYEKAILDVQDGRDKSRREVEAAMIRAYEQVVPGVRGFSGTGS